MEYCKLVGAAALITIAILQTLRTASTLLSTVPAHWRRLGKVRSQTSYMPRVAQLQGRLRLAGRGDLVQEIGHVVSTKSAGGQSLLEGFGNLLRAISTKQAEQFLKLAESLAPFMRTLPADLPVK